MVSIRGAAFLLLSPLLCLLFHPQVSGSNTVVATRLWTRPRLSFWSSSLALLAVFYLEGCLWSFASLPCFVDVGLFFFFETRSEHCQKSETCPLATLGIMKKKRKKIHSHTRVSSFQAPNPSLQLMKINWGEPKSMPPERDCLPFQKAIFFSRGINEMTNRISPPLPMVIYGSVSQPECQLETGVYR